MSDLTIKIFEVEFNPPYEKFETEQKLLEAVEPYLKYGVKAGEFKEGSYINSAEYDSVRQMLSGQDVLNVLSDGLKFEVKSTRAVQLSASEIFQVMGEKPQVTLEQAAPVESNYNNHCEVHMPGQALSMYNNTMLMEDACTDALQSELEQGWRIIAACPQPDQRRPDYILGRFDPVVTNGSARRG